MKAAALLLAASLLGGCLPSSARAAITMHLTRSGTTPRDASVIIDEQYVGPLAYVAARGVRLPVGTHRITVQKEGYFPWDQLVEADRAPVTLRVELTPIPD
jgi:hypothetical protein